MFWRYIHKKVFDFMRLRQPGGRYRNYSNTEWMSSKDTDFTRKYTKDDYYYALEEQFLDSLDELPVEYSTSILLQIDKVLSKDYPEPANIFTAHFGSVAGVVKSKPPLFFSVKFVNLKKRYPVLYRLDIIDCDDYLDYIIQNKTFTSESIKNQTVS
tara:strand:+ start:223 stop:690 length:468 start_codon:yes stop_codon:yes gene_type:complete